ncbi:hypothetical protein ACSBR2_007287 [Camellia fascicularis]
MESLKFGVPIVAIAMHLDQPINIGLVEEVGVIRNRFRIFTMKIVVALTHTHLDPSLVAMKVNRDINGRLNREDIAQVIRKVVVEKSGEGFKN